VSQWPLTNPKVKPWLQPAGWALLVALLFTAITLIVVDLRRGEGEWLSLAEKNIGQDLKACIEASDLGTEEVPSWCELCKLRYNREGKLVSWTNNPLLPPLEDIQSLGNLQLSEEFLFSQNRTYYQQWSKVDDEQVEVLLAPVHIPYSIDNNFLIPYLFLGRYTNRFEAKDIKRVAPYGPLAGQHIRLRSPNNTLLLTYKGLPWAPFRKPLRQSVILLISTSLILLLFLLRGIYKRYFPPLQSDLLFVASVCVVRVVLFLTDMPSGYLNWGLFSPEILGFHDVLAPTVGDLTFNVLLYSIFVWVIYKHSFRLITVLYRKILSKPAYMFIYLLVVASLSILFLKVHLLAFDQMIDNSQVDMEFSNLFATDYHAFIILLDMGILLFAFYLLLSLLIRPFVIHIMQSDKPNLWAGVLAIFLILAGFTFNASSPGLIAISIASMILWVLSMLRFPETKILKFDLVNYLIILFVGTTITAYAILVAATNNVQHEIEYIAERVLENRLEKATIGFERTKRQLRSPDVNYEIQRKYRELVADPQNPNTNQQKDYVSWFGNAILSKNFEAFERNLFAYDSDWNRIDGRLNNDPPRLPEPLGTGDTVRFRDVMELQPGLYQTPNADAAFDTYISLFNIEPGPGIGTIHFLLELSPNPYGLGSVSPIVLVGDNTYREDALFKRFDYAIYREGVLANVSGNSIFKTGLSGEEMGHKPEFRTSDDQVTYLRSGSAMQGTTRTIAVRYPKRSLNQVFTTFSLIFYFFTFAYAILFIVPTVTIRLFRNRDFVQTLPIRTKIRIAIVSVSFMPILGIIVFLQPYIQSRFEADAKAEINTETQRVSRLVENSLGEIASLPGDKNFTDSLLADFRAAIPLDITVFDKNGIQLGSTQPSLFNSGIYSRLLNEKAKEQFTKEGNSHIVLEESLGNFSFFAGYQALWDKTGKETGFVQVAYLNKKEALNDQITSLLAYLANIYLLAFLAVGIISVLVSNALTQPLSIIKLRLENTRLGTNNEPISSYKSKDEIGAIVKAYNAMVSKLGDSEQALKATQRQLAWRQMARQVAHEIKNPLTPMKLSIQHLMRTWSSKSPNLEKMFPKVMKTLLTQIESMVNIADSFSQFAKMPEAKKDHIILQDVIHDVVDLYKDDSLGVNWHLDLPEPPFEIFADPDQLARSLGNIVKNAIQAMEDNDKASSLHILFRVRDAVAQIEITDTGKGMSDEIKKRIFEPNFSTKNSGMGMGLAIVRRTIEINGGSIEFESEYGIGTTFYVRIPMAGIELPEKRMEEEEA
jgi:signal transduction histidine kinase